ncbi:hypothetical protein [Frankia sp. Cj3]|uniref:hypothetical protein n=1 Tax=Frankia sp. Cj3 TaxID=2880976 RepID=UPI001EF52B72|nr:hypothetical protein [Frankia sp. Cj3]
MTVTEIALTESQSLRSGYAERTDALDKVKALAMLPGDLHMTTEMVASYFEVDIEAIKKVVQRNREELTKNGLRVLRGEELRIFKQESEGQPVPHFIGAPALTLFTRPAILNVGMLLTESDIAKKVRSYLLEVEAAARAANAAETAPAAQREPTSIERAATTKAQLEAVAVAHQFGLTNASYIEGLTRTLLARMTGEEPNLDPQDVTITCDEYVDGRNLSAKNARSARTVLGTKVAALYRQRYGQNPQKIRRYIDGVHRDVSVYTRRDADLFDAAWSEIAGRYTTTAELRTVPDITA